MVVTAQVYRECIDRIDYDGLPPLYRSAMRRYIEQGCEPGTALLQVLQNDLKVVLLFNDLEALHSIVAWINRELPDHTWGNRAVVQNWMRLAHRHSKVGVSPAAQPFERSSTHEAESSRSSP